MTATKQRYELTDKGREYLAISGQLAEIETALESPCLTDEERDDLIELRVEVEAKIEQLLSEP